MKKKYIAPQAEQVIIKTGSLLQVVSGASDTTNPVPPFDPTPTDEPADSRYYRHNDWDDEDEDF